MWFSFFYQLTFYPLPLISLQIAHLHIYPPLCCWFVFLPFSSSSRSSLLFHLSFLCFFVFPFFLLRLDLSLSPVNFTTCLLPAGIPSRMRRTCLWWWTCSWEATCATTSSRTSTSRRALSNSTSVNWPWLLGTSAPSASYTGENLLSTEPLNPPVVIHHKEEGWCLRGCPIISLFFHSIFSPCFSTTTRYEHQAPWCSFLLGCPLLCYFLIWLPLRCAERSSYLDMKVTPDRTVYPEPQTMAIAKCTGSVLPHLICKMQVKCFLGRNIFGCGRPTDSQGQQRHGSSPEWLNELSTLLDTSVQPKEHWRLTNAKFTST